MLAAADGCDATVLRTTERITTAPRRAVAASSTAGATSGTPPI